MQNKAKVSLILAVSMVMVVMPVLGDDGEKTEQHKRYVTAQGIAGTCLVKENLSIGNACFHLDENSSKIYIDIDDDYFDVVHGDYRLFDGPWDTNDPPEFIDEGTFCTNTEVELPENARYVIVFVDGHVGTPIQCDDGVGQGASIGTITVTEVQPKENFTILR